MTQDLQKMMNRNVPSVMDVIVSRRSAFQWEQFFPLLADLFSSFAYITIILLNFNLNIKLSEIGKIQFVLQNLIRTMGHGRRPQQRHSL